MEASAVAQWEPTTDLAPGDELSLEARHSRLLDLVGELVLENQELRFRLELVERQAETAERGLAKPCAGAGMLML